MTGRLLIFCGIPGSGKTTKARLVAKSDPNAAHIQTDAIRRFITIPTISPEQTEYVYGVRTEAARAALDERRRLIIDATFGSARRREKTLRVLEGHYSRADFVLVKCDMQTALRRNGARIGEAVVPEGRAMDIILKFEAPEGALTVDSAGDPQGAADEIVQRLLYPLLPPE